MKLSHSIIGSIIILLVLALFSIGSLAEKLIIILLTNIYWDMDSTNHSKENK